jgi:Zn-finger in ubiquitin-hydrolases and other protein
MEAHFTATRHPITLSPDDLAAWCYECEAYLDTFAYPELFRAYAAVHQHKFGHPPAVPPSIAIMLEDVGADGQLTGK